MSAEDVSEGSGSEASGDEFEEETIVPVSTATPAALAAAPVAPTGGPVTGVCASPSSRIPHAAPSFICG